MPATAVAHCAPRGAAEVAAAPSSADAAGVARAAPVSSACAASARTASPAAASCWSVPVPDTCMSVASGWSWKTRQSCTRSNAKKSSAGCSGGRFASWPSTLTRQAM